MSGREGSRGGGPPGRVVIVGAGQAGTETAAALRARGFGGRVTLVGDEDAPPYERPPLSKGFLTGDVPEDQLALRPDAFYTGPDTALVRGDPVLELDRDLNAVVLRSGRRLPYDRLVLATGARPRRLPVPGAELAGVLTLRDLADARTLRRELGHAPQLVVVGGGFIGLELAATAARLGAGATVVEAGRRVLARAVSGPLSDFLTAEHRAHGTRLLLSREVTAVHGDRAGHARVVELDGGERIPADLVVVGIGVLPEVRLAADAGLAVGGGVLVDRRLRTSDPAVYAIGDCARFPSPYTGPRAAGKLRLESVQNACGQARCVAAGICGEPEPYTAVPWFWTEQHGLRVQIAGITAGHDRTVVAGDPGARRFSVFCFAGERLLGVESVNRTADHMITRKLLAAAPYGPELTPDDVAAPGFDLKRLRQGAPGGEQRAVAV